MEFQHTQVSETGFTLHPKRLISNENKCILNGPSLCLKDPKQIWDLRKFQTVRKPVIIGSFYIKYDAKYPRVLDMPIKFNGSAVRVPKEFAGLRDFIQQVIDFEYTLNTASDMFYAYLTVDQGFIDQGKTQRRAGCHVDCFQGARIYPKAFINRSYVVSNCLPTVWYPHSFETSHMNEECDNFFLDFDRQAKEELAWRPQSNKIVMSDAYCVHRCDYANKNIYRSFVRLSFDVKKFDRLGNTHNPMFNYNWKMVARDIQKNLK